MKILAIASAGGHWVQLLRLLPSFQNQDITFMSTKANFADTVKGKSFFLVPDASRWNKFRLIYLGFCVAKVVIAKKPDIIITTGAAPGLMGILAGKLIGSKTIWVDSVANVEKLSMCGKMATFIADKVFTQWKHLSTGRINYSGSVFA